MKSSILNIKIEKVEGNTLHISIHDSGTWWSDMMDLIWTEMIRRNPILTGGGLDK